MYPAFTDVIARMVELLATNHACDGHVVTEKFKAVFQEFR